MMAPPAGRYRKKYGWTVRIEADKADIEADLAKLRDAVKKAESTESKKAGSTTPSKITVGMVTDARYKIKGKFYNKVYPCEVVARVKCGWTVRWLDGDLKDTFKLEKDFVLK